MSIIYTLIIKDKNIIMAEYTEYNGNFEQVSRNLIGKVKKNHKATLSYDDM